MSPLTDAWNATRQAPASLLLPAQVNLWVGTAVQHISPSSFWAPSYIVDSAWLEHGPFAFWLVDAICLRVVVKFGLRRGFSYFCFCQVIDRLGLNAKAYAVDTRKGDEHAGFYGEDVFQELSAYHERYSAFSRGCEFYVHLRNPPGNSYRPKRERFYQRRADATKRSIKEAAWGT
jgi:hypothetical protein